MKYKCSLCGEPTDNILLVGDYDIHWCDKCSEKWGREYEWRKDGYTHMRDEIICPYCGFAYEDCNARQFESDQEEVIYEKVTCENCEKKFDLGITTTRAYSTRRSVCEMPEDYGRYKKCD